MHIESPQLPMGMKNMPSQNTRHGWRTNSYRSERGLYSHIRELLGYLPREKALVDKLVDGFLRELNQVYDGLHEETFIMRYEAAFWNRRWSDDDRSVIDLRWLGLLFIVLAFGELLESPIDASPDIREECEETSLQFYWASRTTITLAMTFWGGESTDLVRCCILIPRYLVYLGRKTESWFTSGFSVCFAQAKGMHIEWDSWGLPAIVLETRRRLWCSVHSLEKSISLALGRPSSTNEKNCMEMKIKNVCIDEKAEDETLVVVERPENDPMPSMFYIYQQRLAKILGVIQECFCLPPLTTSYNCYAKVLNLDKILLEWAGSLPVYFQFENADMTMDNARPYLFWQRLYLHFAFHFARVTLHRTYVLLESITDRFQYSRDVCISSASADLKLKLSIRNLTMADRLRAGTSMHSLFSSALVLGILVAHDPLSARTSTILQDLPAYCEMRNCDPWANEFVLAEVKVIELCISTATKSRQDSEILERQRTSFIPSVSNDGAEQTSSVNDINNPNEDQSAGILSEGHEQSIYQVPGMNVGALGIGAGLGSLEMQTLDSDDWLEN